MTKPQAENEIRWQREHPERNLQLETVNLSRTLIHWLRAYELVPDVQRAMTDNLTRSAVIQTLGVIDRGKFI
jgi:hypothetical protein